MRNTIKNWYKINRGVLHTFLKCFIVVILCVSAIAYTTNPYVEKIYLFITFCFLQTFVFEHYLEI